MLQLVNRQSGERLAEDVREAKTFCTRFAGLMFTGNLPEGSGLHIEPCRSVHTFFMRYPIDVLYLDEFRNIVGIDEGLAPGKLGGSHRNAVSVVELPAGRAKRTGACVGQAVAFIQNEYPKLKGAIGHDEQN